MEKKSDTTIEATFILLASVLDKFVSVKIFDKAKVEDTDKNFLAISEATIKFPNFEKYSEDEK